MAPSRGGDVRPLGAGDTAALEELWPQIHPDQPCCAGAEGATAALELGRGWAVEAEGRLAGAAILRTWGRVAHLHAFGVRDDARGRGLGRRLLAGVVDALRRADLAVVGAELPAEDPVASALLGAHGFRPQPPTWLLERSCAAAGTPAHAADQPVHETGDEPEPEHDGTTTEDGATEGTATAGPGLPEGWRLLDREPAAGDLARVADLAASLDSDLDPVPWLEGLLAASAAQAAWSEAGGGALVVLPRTGGDALRAGLLLLDQSAPFDGLADLVAALDALARAEGRRRLLVPGPTRGWDAVEALLGLGFRPVASRPRFTLRGHPDRSDLRRLALASWR